MWVPWTVGGYMSRWVGDSGQWVDTSPGWVTVDSREIRVQDGVVPTAQGFLMPLCTVLHLYGWIAYFQNLSCNAFGLLLTTVTKALERDAEDMVLEPDLQVFLLRDLTISPDC